MAQLILQDELIKAVNNNTFIKNGNHKSCEGMKYDFRLSDHILKSGVNSEVSISQIKPQHISPGEVVFVMTEETLELPDNIYCQLSTKRKLSHDGIMVLGGFVIDPKYSGKLVFGLYNISSRDYRLIPGRKLVAGVFYKLNESESKSFINTPESIHDFPDDLVKMIDGYKSIMTENLGGQLSALQADIAILKDQINTDKTWKKDFQELLDKNNRHIEKNNEQIEKINHALFDLTKKLSDEASARTLAIDALGGELKTEITTRQTESTQISNTLSILKGIGLVLSTLVGGGLVALLIAWLTGVFNLG